MPLPRLAQYCSDKCSLSQILRNFLFSVALSLIFALLLTGCGSGTSTAATTPPAIPPVTPPKTATYITGRITPLNFLWRVVMNSTDRTVTSSVGDTTVFPFEGALFYVPQANVSSSVPIFNVLSSDKTDHFVSLSMNERGGTLASALGSAYPSAEGPTGLTQLIRTANSATGDHSLRNTVGLETEQGYTDEPIAAYGYPRYYNVEPMLSLSGGGVTIESNQAAGGALWHWTFNGVQIVNNGSTRGNTGSYGRQIQSALFVGTGAAGSNQGVNPTEGGDFYSDTFAVPGLKHGSPLLSGTNRGLTQSTRAVPLDFVPDGTLQNEPNLGGGASNPVLWQDLIIGKDLTLNFMGMGPVARYTAVLSIPNKIPSGGAVFVAPVAFLRASFVEFHIYDAASHQDTNVTQQVCSADSNGRLFAPEFGGMIARDPVDNVVFGIYGVNVSQGGGFSHLNIGSQANPSCSSTPSGEFDFNTAYLSFLYSGALAGGTTTVNSYFVSGLTVADVEAKMDALKSAGVK